MNKTSSGFLVLLGIIAVCVGGYFVVKKIQENDINEEEENEEENDKEEPSVEMPIRASESDSKTRSTEPIDLESYKSFLNRKTSYTNSTVADTEENDFGAESTVEKTAKNFFDIIDIIPQSYYDGGQDIQAVLYYNNGSITLEGESYLKDEDMNILKGGSYPRLKTLLDNYSRGTGGEWTDVYVVDNVMHVVYSVSNMEE